MLLAPWLRYTSDCAGIEKLISCSDDLVESKKQSSRSEEQRGGHVAANSHCLGLEH